MIFKDGISQKDRGQHISGENEFGVDEMTFHQLVCYVKDFARNIKYYNNSNKHDGTWDELLVADEIIVFSEIMNLNIHQTESDFINNSTYYIDNPLLYLSKQITLILNLAGHWNSWHKLFYNLESKSETGMLNEIDTLIRHQLSPGFLFCINLVEQYKLNGNNLSKYRDRQEFSEVWWYSQQLPETKSPEEINKQLKKIFYAFNNSVHYLKKTAGSYLDTVLKHQEHSPFHGMLFTFLKLLQQSRETLNNFARRYFDFYYHEVLKIEPKKYKPDSTILLFALKDGIDEFYLKKGSRFIGGKDELNKKLFYASDKDLVINRATLGKIQTLYFDRNELIWPKCKCTNIIKDEIDATSVEKFNPENTKKWPLFGGSMKKGAKFAEIGFAISDINLLLGEGNRQVSLDLIFTEQTFAAFKERLTTVKNEYTLEEVFIKLFPNIFNIYLTTDKGWLKIYNYIINCSFIDENLSKNTIRIQFKLSVSDPAITPFNKDIHSDGFVDGLPAIKIILNNNSYLFAYSLIQDLEIVKLMITAKVTGLKSISLANESGKIDLSKPFQPFGPIPALNSYFIISNFELSKKQITALELKIKWNNLPGIENGLKEYFRTYNKSISQHDYKCNITFLNNGEWLPQKTEQQQVLNLFQPDGTENHPSLEKIDNLSIFTNIETQHFQAVQPKIALEDFKYSNYSVGGFIKFSLTNPAFMFGHSHYPELVTKITLENAKKKRQKPLPNPPFSPMAESITLAYTAQSSINFSGRKPANTDEQERFYHVHPWGIEDMSTDTQKKAKKIIPGYPAQGNLYLGLTNIKPNTTVSIFFNLVDDSAPEVEKDPPKLTWNYLSSNTWKEIPAENLVGDSTDGFLTPGIIVVRIPDDINLNNTILSNKYYWICIAANERLDTVCSVVNILTQAVQVTWENNNNSLSHLRAPLPAFSIAKPDTVLPGIKMILQPVRSFNGRPHEDFFQTHIRIGERLIHKNRAVLPRDYETLVLENFPEIYKVKCIPNMSSEKKTAPGHVLIAVIKNIEPENIRMNFEPMVNNTTLQKIKAFIAEIAPPTVRIEIRNPVYERIQVRCSVKIKEGLDAGYFLDLLNNELISHLTLWQSNSKSEPGFGKVIKCTDVLAYIQGFEYIEFVTDFSLLQIIHNNKTEYSLLDTATRTYREIQDSGDTENYIENEPKVLKPKYPWGILISADKHAIEAIDRLTLIEPVKTGIDELEVGGTFIIK
jgi:hypothetical protein